MVGCADAAQGVDALGQVLGQGVQAFGAQQVHKVFVGEQLFEALDDQEQALVGVLGFEDHLALALHLALVGAHQAVAGGGWFDLVAVGGCRAVFHALFDQALGLDDLAALELAVLVGLLKQVAQVGLAVAFGGVFIGAGNFQGRGQRDGAALHAFDQAFLPLVKQEHDVFDVFWRQARLLDDDLGAVAAFAQHLDVGQDLQRSVTAPGDVFGQAHDEGVFIGHVHHQGGDVGFTQDTEGVEPPLATDQHIARLAIVARAFGHGDGFFEADGADVVHDLLKDLHVAVAGVEDLDPVDGNERDGVGGAGRHERLLFCGGRVDFGFIGGLPFWGVVGVVVPGGGSDTALQSLTLGHSVEEVQVVKAKALEVGAVPVADADLLIGQVQPGQQVVVHLLGIGGVQPDGDGDVWIKLGRVKSDAPALMAVGCRLAAGQHQADDQLVVEGQQIGLGVAGDVAAQFGDGVLGAADDFWVQLAQAAVHFQKLGAARAVVSHQLVGSGQAAKALDLSGRTGQRRGLVNDETRQAPAFGI